MKPIRRSTILNACWPALLLLGLPFFFKGGPSFHSARSFTEAWDLGHVLYFCLFTLWLARMRPDQQVRLNPALRRLLLLALPFLAGYVVEWLQVLSKGGSPSLDDMLKNLLGSALALCFLDRPPRREEGGGTAKPGLAAAMTRGLVLLWLLAILSPTFAALWDEYQARRQFPTLAAFESRFELTRWYHPRQLRLERGIARQGGSSGRAQLSTAKYSGVTLMHFPRDWRGYQRLRFSVYNPLAEPLELHCRLDDAPHRRTRDRPYTDRFNARFTLRPGWNDLAVSLEEAAAAPRGRRMDMARIIGFGLFVVEQKEAIAIHLDDVRLE